MFTLIVGSALIYVYRDEILKAKIKLIEKFKKLDEPKFKIYERQDGVCLLKVKLGLIDWYWIDSRGERWAYKVNAYQFSSLDAAKSMIEEVKRRIITEKEAKFLSSNVKVHNL